MVSIVTIDNVEWVRFTYFEHRLPRKMLKKTHEHIDERLASLTCLNLAIKSSNSASVLHANA